MSNLNRRLFAIGVAASPLGALPASAESREALINRYAAALYEAYQPASNGSAMTYSLHWDKALGSEREFGLRYAESVLTNLGLI